MFRSQPLTLRGSGGLGVGCTIVAMAGASGLEGPGKLRPQLFAQTGGERSRISFALAGASNHVGLGMLLVFRQPRIEYSNDA